MTEERRTNEDVNVDDEYNASGETSNSNSSTPETRRRRYVSGRSRNVEVC